MAEAKVLTVQKYLPGKISSSSHQSLSLGSIADFQNGFAFKKSQWNPMGYPIIRIQNLTSNDNAFNYTNGEGIDDKYAVNHGDLLMSWSGTLGFYIWRGGKAYLNQHIYRVDVNDKVLKKYLYYLGESIISIALKNLHGNTMQHITKGKLETIEVPVPQISEQAEIVEELDQLQQTVNGLKTAIQAFKPTFLLDRKWEVFELGKVIDGSPKNGYSAKEVKYETSLKVLSLSATSTGVLDLTHSKYVNEDIPFDSELRCRENDIFLQRGNTRDLVGMPAIFDSDSTGYIYPDLMIRIRANEKIILPRYLYYSLLSPMAREFVKKSASSSAGSMPKINQSIVVSIPIPVPPMDIQRQIIDQLDFESKTIAHAKKLVDVIESKIQGRISQIWDY
ncbi:MAG: restriction endonuclease subunit S [Patescibacteria group bacterium]